MTEDEKKRYEQELARTLPGSDPRLAKLGAFARATMGALGDDDRDHSECGHTADTDRAHCVYGAVPGLLEASIQAHDLNATALTEVRKSVRLALSGHGLSTQERDGLLARIVDTLNLNIIASRKIAKGELP